MRVVIATVGTRGDVQPMLALAQALKRRGHQPVVACPESFAAWVRSYDIEHHALGEDLQALIAAGGDAPERSIIAMKNYFREQMARQAPRLLQIATGAQAIVATGMAWMAPSVAEQLSICALMLFPTSCARSRQHPPPLMPWYGLPTWVNGLLWSVNDALQNHLMGEPVNAARAELGLAPVAAFTDHLFVTTPGVIAADELLLPPDPAWKGRYPYVGYLFLDDPAPLDVALEAWLASGEPPICVGFGSMVGRRPERVAGLLAEALRGRRCLVLGAAAELFAAGAWPAGFYAVREAPHQQLFPRVAAVVHHGGAGTTAAALRAGVPQVVLPMMLDQFHHAHHLTRVGVAPRAPSMAKVTADGLRSAIEHALALPAAPRELLAERVRSRAAGDAIIDLLVHMTAAR